MYAFIFIWRTIFRLCKPSQLGAGICFGPAAPIVGHWFLKRRGLAFGITAAGSSLGGTVYPIMARQLINAVG